MPMKYIARLFDDVITQSLKRKGAVIVEGPKWCGKSTTAKKHCASIIDLLPTNTRDGYVALAKTSPQDFLSLGEAPLLIDEWQHVSFIFDDIKTAVDERGFGQFILTGSVTDKSVEKRDDDRYAQHTGNGRIIRRRMRTLSFFESGEGNGAVSLLDLKNGVFKAAPSSFTLKNYAFAICRGGWPLAFDPNLDQPLEQAKDYFDVLCSDDLFSIKAVPLDKNEEKARLFMRSYARGVSSAMSEETMRKDCLESIDTFDRETFNKYMLALRYLCVVDDVPAWNPNLRSKTALRAKPKRHLTDTSIAAQALGATPDGLFFDMQTFGLLFESLCVHDLHVYATSIGARIYHYQDAKKREADAVIVFNDGSFALVECKLGGNEDIDEAARKLLEISSDIDQQKTGQHAFSMILTKGNLAYRRPDGVYVIPLATLKP